MDREQLRRELKETASAIYWAGIRAVSPEACVREHLRLTGDHLQVGGRHYRLADIRRLLVVGVGKASAAMARAVEELLGDRIDSGLVVTKYGHGLDLARCRLLEAGHPVPDHNGARAAEELLHLVGSSGPGDLILCLLSGGGSALLPAPALGISLEDKQETTRLLLACGASIHEINTLRKHLSRLKGGRLCRAADGAQLVSLILSDVVGDDLDVIASGLTAPDRSTYADCLDLLDRYGLTHRVPAAVLKLLTEGMQGMQEETPKPGDPVLDGVDNLIVGSIATCLAAAAVEAQRWGFTPLILTSTLTGESREVAKFLCAVARESRRFGRPISPPACLLCGGETTVTLRGDGLGGRNMELALSAALELAGTGDILLLSAGTDGTDGPTDAAGAFADATSLARAEKLRLSAAEALANNDAYRFFAPLGDLLLTGPTRTNVMDLQLVLLPG